LTAAPLSHQERAKDTMADTAMPLTNKMTGEEEKMVKDKVQEKLEEYLSSVTDTVLCDYVLVMLGNKKNKGQVTNDLEVPLPTRPPFEPPLPVFAQ